MRDYIIFMQKVQRLFVRIRKIRGNYLDSSHCPDRQLKLIDKNLEYFPQINGFSIHDDWGSQKETFFSPAVIAEMIVPAPTPAQQTVNPTASTVYLIGEAKAFEAHIIGGNNFFRLLDLMQAIDVYVGYDNATKAITLDTSRGYVPE